MFNKDYNFLVKLLHYAVIGNKIVPELLFDLENFLFRKKNKLIRIKHHLYITGLARAGTTIMLRSIYASNKFASLTYRDMPFVISPNLWNYISKYLKTKKTIMRKHNDNILINLDSPEQFEEIFWNLKTSNEYNFKNCLKYYNVNSYNLELYELFIKNCLLKYNKQSYISKNNNNLLRIKSLMKKFPNAKFLIIFRNPLDHSISLMNQHINFSNLQKKDKFIKNYMNCLVHHEFGLNQKQMLFDEEDAINISKDNINFWLLQWINFYKFALKEKLKLSKNIIFVDYKDICTNSEFEFKKISNFIGENIYENIEKKKFLHKTYDLKEFNFISEYVKKSLEIYDNLKN